ncbi:rRNA maturation RNase YbeY [Blattabacterium cuenoti]|uniref:rRNA maturation RNase YbeY n=1 Tax=Blattabacterium cuenoti TaxID=1653831 RepID=UPI00163BA2DD|nr:rRNA maturation RNase YbeY [Blattabacterium cuenoti]
MIKLFYEISNFRIKNKYLIFKNIFLLLRNENKYVGNINYIFCNDNYLSIINYKFLKKNYYTDVIAFNYSFKEYISGDIFISIDRVLENSKIWNQFFLIELKRIMIHAILHFLGYDDKNKKDRIIMKKKEDFYINLFQY